MDRRKFLSTIGVGAAAAGLAACASDSDDDTDAQGESGGGEGGLITIIVNDPSNPYWKTEGDLAAAKAEELGYSATVGAHKGDTNEENSLVDTAISNQSVAMIMDPADADGSIGAVKKVVDADIPEIGRASWRERGEGAELDDALKMSRERWKGVGSVGKE